MNNLNTIYCLFEQSGTFKNEFRDLGYNSFDYDILNEYDQTDVQVDLFKEINFGYDNKESMFDLIYHNDLVMAFFPCTRFDSQFNMNLRCVCNQYINLPDIEKLKINQKFHNEVVENFNILNKLVYLALDRGFRLIIENPYTKPNYLAYNWCFEPSIIDYDRRKDGDYYKKPTQYFFINCCPEYNILFEPLKEVENRTIDKINCKDRQRLRSEISSQYANRFIRKYILTD